MKLLGYEIDAKIENLERNFDKCITKMRKTIGNWSRFRLSLPGRIAIVKSLVLSQVTFHGTLLDPNPEQLAIMSEIMENFVMHNIVIAKERIYAPAKLGGLGMIKLEPFLVAQKCAWIKRCFIKINDPWRWEFLRICGFSLNMVRVANFEKAKNPMLWAIVNAFSKFQESYWKKNENFLEASVFDNNFFFVEKPRPRAPVPGCISTRIIRRRTREEFCIELLSIKMKSLLVEGQIVDFNRFVRSTRVPVTANEYLSLIPAATYARER
jgi:hypothetical protein